MSSEPIHLGHVDVNAIVRDLMDVARVTVSPSMEQIPEEYVRAVLSVLLELVDNTMPGELQAQDRRVQTARATLQLLQR